MNTKEKKTNSVPVAPLPKIPIDMDSAKVLAKLIASSGIIKSNSEAMRLIQSGAVDIGIDPEDNRYFILKIGKYKFLKVTRIAKNV